MADRFFRTPISLPADPTQPLEAVTKQYVDGRAMIDGGNYTDTYIGGSFNIDGGGFATTPPGNNIVLAQYATGTGSSAATGASTGSLTTTTGSTFLILCAGYGASVPTISVSDNKSNTYTPLMANVRASDGTTMRAFLCAGGNGGSGHTFSMSTTATASNYCAIIAVEIKGSTGVLDGSVVSATGTTATLSSGNITTTNAYDALIGLFALDASAFPAPATANTLTLLTTVPGTANNIGLGLSYELESAVVTKAASFTSGNTTTGTCAAIFALKST